MSLKTSCLKSVEPKFVFVPYGWFYSRVHILRAMGQKNCSIKDEDELAQIIGKYRMTSELHWVDFKTELDSQTKKTVVKKDSYSSDSLEEYSVTDHSKTSLNDNFDIDTNNDKSLSQSSTDTSSVHDNSSITTTYSFEIIEETEVLQIDSIKEAIDIRISPTNSTVMSFTYPDNSSDEFTPIANIEEKMLDVNENIDDSISGNVPENIDDSISENVPENIDDSENGNLPKDIDTKTKELSKVEDMAKCEEQSEIKYPEIQAIDINANDTEKAGENKPDLKSASDSDPSTPKKTGYYASKIEIIKKENKAASSVEKKIAEEIKELKEREEDLRSTREKLAKEISVKIAAKKNFPLLPPPVQSKPDKNVSSSPSGNKIEEIKTTFAKVENTCYTQARVFAIKKKDAPIKEDVLETTKDSPSAIPYPETRVQRDIRIAKEREEELKREREQALKSKMEMDSINSESAKSDETDADSALSICSDSSFDSVSKLAPLFPENGSPELSTSNEISLYSSSAGSMCSLDSLSQRERQGNRSESVGGSVLSLSPDSAAKAGFPKISTEKRSKSVDMERFIASKGKEIKFKGDNGKIYSTYEIKPPQIKKGEEQTCKRFVPAAAKIKNELKELQEREEEFKRERANIKQDLQNVKQSQESDAKKYKEPISQENAIETTAPASPKNQQDILGDSENANHKKKEYPANQGRRRSVLVDEWEMRIQKSTSPP